GRSGVRRTDVVLTGLAIAAIGVAIWTIVGSTPTGLLAVGAASFGLVISVSALIFMREPVAADEAIRIRTRDRLRAHAAQAIRIANEVGDENAMRGRFGRECRDEMLALRDFVQEQYGMRARDDCMGYGPLSRESANSYSDAVNDLANRIDRH